MNSTHLWNMQVYYVGENNEHNEYIVNDQLYLSPKVDAEKSRVHTFFLMYGTVLIFLLNLTTWHSAFKWIQAFISFILLNYPVYIEPLHVYEPCFDMVINMDGIKLSSFPTWRSINNTVHYNKAYKALSSFKFSTIGSIAETNQHRITQYLIYNVVIPQ